MSERINTPEQRDKRAELIVRFLDLAENITPLKGKKVEHILKTEEDRRRFINSLSEEEFFELLNGTNGILRNKDKDQWTVDGGEVMLTGFIGEHIPPRQQDKIALLQKVYNVIEKMSESGRGLEDVAILLSASINEVHPYADANGRTSRLLFTLLTKGYHEKLKDELKSILGEYGRDVVDIDPSSISKYLENLIVSEIGLNDEKKNPKGIANVLYAGRLDKHKFGNDISESFLDEFFNALRHDTFYMNLAMYQFINKNPNIEKYIKTFPTHSSIMLENISPDVKKEDLEKIMEFYWGLKRRYAELLIDSIANPEKPEYAVEPKNGSDQKTILDLFKKQIKERQEKNFN